MSLLVCLLALHLPITSRQDLPLLNNPSNITIQGYIVYTLCHLINQLF